MILIGLNYSAATHGPYEHSAAVLVARVPVVGDEIFHNDFAYRVTRVVLYTAAQEGDEWHNADLVEVWAELSPWAERQPPA